MLAMNKLGIVSAVLLTVAVLSSCKDKQSRGLEYAPNMYKSVPAEFDEPNKNFRNGQTAQVPPANTIPLDYDKYSEYENSTEGYLKASAELKNPLKVNEANLSEGKVLYLNMCGHCHGPQGKGDGSIVKLEKFPAPPSYSTGNSSRGGLMKDLTDGKIFHTITNGVNLMGPHKYQLNPEERWKIVMYVHELQKLQ